MKLVHALNLVEEINNPVWPAEIPRQVEGHSAHDFQKTTKLTDLVSPSDLCVHSPFREVDKHRELRARCDSACRNERLHMQFFFLLQKLKRLTRLFVGNTFLLRLGVCYVFEAVLAEPETVNVISQLKRIAGDIQLNIVFVETWQIVRVDAVSRQAIALGFVDSRRLTDVRKIIEAFNEGILGIRPD